MASGIDARMPTAVEPVRTTPAYRLALGLVALALVVIPGIYLALVGATVWLTGRWASTQYVLVTGIGSGRLGLFLYVVPILVGAIVCYAFVVPLFGRRPPREEGPELTREQAPQLFALEHRSRIRGPVVTGGGSAPLARRKDRFRPRSVIWWGPKEVPHAKEGRDSMGSRCRVDGG